MQRQHVVLGGLPPRADLGLLLAVGLLAVVVWRLVARDADRRGVRGAGLWGPVVGLLLVAGGVAVARVHASVTPVPFLPALGMLAGYLAVRNRSPG